MQIKILFEFTRFLKLQKVVKIDALSIQTRRGLISGGLIHGCICLFTEGPLFTPPPKLIRMRVCVCVCGGGGGGGGGGGLTSASLWYLKRLSTVSSKNKERIHR